MLSPETREKIKAQVAAYPKTRTALLPALKLAQAEVGYLPSEVVAEVAELVGVSHAAAQELTSFYSMLRTEPTGKLHMRSASSCPARWRAVSGCSPSWPTAWASRPARLPRTGR